MTRTGQVAYLVDRMTTRLHLSRRTIAYHVRYLRELGLIAWLSHGSKTNSHRARGKPGYAATATIYAATVPPAWDTAMGRITAGRGCRARVTGVTAHGRVLAIHHARQRTRPARPAARCTPSVGTTPTQGQVQVGGKNNNTARPRRAPRTTATPTRGNPALARRSAETAAWVRPRIPWAQTCPLRRLGYALRPWIEAGHTPQDIAAELTSWWLTWRPADPAAYILARAHRTRPDQEPGTPAPTEPQTPQGVPPNASFRAAAAELHVRRTAKPPTCLTPAQARRWEHQAAHEALQRALAAPLPPRQQPLTFAAWERQTDQAERTAWRQPQPADAAARPT